MNRFAPWCALLILSAACDASVEPDAGRDAAIADAARADATLDTGTADGGVPVDAPASASDTPPGPDAGRDAGDPGPCPALITGTSAHPVTLGVPLPALNVPFVDPVFHTTVRRVTEASDVDDRDPPSWVRHEYSRRPALNADGSRAIMISSNGWFRLYAVANDGSFTFTRTLDLADSQEPSWHPTDPDRLFHLGRYGGGMQIHELNVVTGASTVYRDLAARLRAELGSSAASAWTKGEGRPSDDGRIWCFMVENSSFGLVGLASYDAVEDRILGTLATTERPDHISTSPLGNYCVPSWTSSRGTRAYTLDFEDFTQLHDRSEHSDLAVTEDGDEVLVYSSYASGFVEMVDLVSGDHTQLFSLYGPNHSSTAMHLSGTSSARPGWAVASFYGCTEDYGRLPCDPSTQWFVDQVVLVELAADPRIVRLAHTHGEVEEYFAETQAVADRTLSRVLFASPWERGALDELASYLIDVPACAFER